MAWTPSQLLSLNLLFKLFNRAVNLLIFFKVAVEIIKHLVNIFVDPVTVLKFDDEVESVDLRQMVLTVWNILQVIEEHEHDSCNLLLAMIIHNLGNFLNDSHGVVLVEFMRKLMVTQDPKHTEHVVTNLMRRKAIIVK